MALWKKQHPVGKGGAKAISAINVTPLVDVMLVLLIIFMVTATLIRPDDETEREVDMTLPETREQQTADPSSQDNLILSISSSLAVTLNDESLLDCSSALTSTARDRFESCFDDLQRNLAGNTAVAERGALYIMAELDVPYGFVVGILHRVRVSGVERVGMVTHPSFLSLRPTPGR